MRLLALLLPLAACIESNLQGEKPDPEPFDPGDTAFGPDTATDTDSGGPPDTADTVITGDACDPRSFPATALTPLPECGGGTAASPAWELEERWTDASLGWMISSPVMVNLTDDNGNGRIDDNDVPDVIAAPYTGGIYAMDGADGSRIWEVTSTQIEQSTPAVGDVDYDGFPEVFVQGLYGSRLISGVDGTTLWEGRAPSSIKTYCGGPGIADFEGDGSVEIYFGRLILDGATGATLAEGTAGQGTSIPGEGPISVAADIDLDGELELVTGNTVYEADGSIVWNKGGSPDGFPAVADFDSDPEGEILVAAQGSAFLYDTDGDLLWSYRYPGAGGYGGPPAVADVDGDGLPEAILPYQAGVVVLDVDGNELWSYTHTGGALYDGVSAYDFDGDGDWEVVLTTPDDLLLFDGPDGDILDSWPNSGVYTCGQEPTMADIDNDGHAEIAYSFGVYYDGPGGVTVLGDRDGFAAALAVWNQHQYSITNIDNDGAVPATPDVNWADMNNFRAGPPIEYIYEDQNLVPRIHDICADFCDAGEVTVWWSVGNDGQGEVSEDFTVRLWGDTTSGRVLLHETTWTASLAAGTLAAAVETSLTGVPVPLYDLEIEVDGGADPAQSEVSECDETDNTDAWGALICL